MSKRPVVNDINKVFGLDQPGAITSQGTKRWAHHRVKGKYVGAHTNSDFTRKVEWRTCPACWIKRDTSVYWGHLWDCLRGKLGLTA